MCPPRRQYRDRIGFWKSGEIVEIAVGAVGILDVAVAQTLRRTGNDGNRAIAHQGHQTLAALGEFLLVHGVHYARNTCGERSQGTPAPRALVHRRVVGGGHRPHLFINEHHTNAHVFDQFCISLLVRFLFVQLKAAGVGDLGEIVQ